VHGVHEAFSTSDVIAYSITLKEVNPESQLSRLNGGRQTGRAASDNTDSDLTHLPAKASSHPLRLLPHTFDILPFSKGVLAKSLIEPKKICPTK
jgi:hypothetical protein